MYGKFQIVTRRFRMRLMPQVLAFSSSLVTLKFSFIKFLKIFDAEFLYKLSYFEPLCLPAKMAAETVIRPIHTCFGRILTANFDKTQVNYSINPLYNELSFDQILVQ